MPDGQVKIEIDDRGMRLYRHAIKNGSRTKEVDDMFKKWEQRYLSFIQERFDTNSKGGGTWPALADSTVARRKKGKDGKRKGSILRDTGTLMRAINPRVKEALGRWREEGIDYIEVGYDEGGDDHPSVGSATVGQIALYHHTEYGNRPARPIIVGPNKQTREGMEKDALTMLKKLGKRFNQD